MKDGKVSPYDLIQEKKAHTRRVEASKAAFKDVERTIENRWNAMKNASDNIVNGRAPSKQKSNKASLKRGDGESEDSFSCYSTSESGDSDDEDYGVPAKTKKVPAKTKKVPAKKGPAKAAKKAAVGPPAKKKSRSIDGKAVASKSKTVYSDKVKVDENGRSVAKIETGKKQYETNPNNHIKQKVESLKTNGLRFPEKLGSCAQADGVPCEFTHRWSDVTESMIPVVRMQCVPIIAETILKLQPQSGSTITTVFTRQCTLWDMVDISGHKSCDTVYNNELKFEFASRNLEIGLLHRMSFTKGRQAEGSRSRQHNIVLEDRHQNLLVCIDQIKPLTYHICGKLKRTAQKRRSLVIGDALRSAKLGRTAFQMNGTSYFIRYALKDSDRFGLSDLGRRILEFDAKGERLDNSSDEDSDSSSD